MLEDDDAPRGVLEGVWELQEKLNTPESMRDCIKERCWDKPVRAESFDAARLLAEDFKRRAMPQKKAMEYILGRMTKLNLSREQRKSVEKAVNWVYEEQEHPSTCKGALLRDGYCHLSSKPCQFIAREHEIKSILRAEAPAALPPDWRDHFSDAHVTVAMFAEWTYLELVEVEAELGLVPGDTASPVFVGFRTLADRIQVKHGSHARGYDRNQAVKTIRYLHDLGLIKTEVKGCAGARKRKANGYVRVLPFPRPKLEPKSDQDDFTAAEEAETALAMAALPGPNSLAEDAAPYHPNTTHES